MNPNSTIDPAIARRILAALELKEETGEKEIAWALKIIRQIPGYEKVSVGQAAQDRFLKETLIAIAAEEIAPTTPKDLENLIKEAEEREAAAKEARTKGKREAEEFIKAATPGPPKTPPPPSQTVEGALSQFPPEEASESLVVRITPSFVQRIAGFAKKAVVLPVATPINFFLKAGASAVYSTSNQKGQSTLTPFVLRMHGIESRQLKRTIVSSTDSGKISAESARKLFAVAEAIRKIEIGSPWYIKTVYWAYGGNRVSLLTDLQKIPPAAPLRDFLLTPTADRTGLLIKDVAGQIGQRAIGGLVKKGVTGLLTKLGISVGAEAAGAAAGAPAGPIGIVVGAIVGFITNKLIPWLKEKIAKNKELFLGILAAGIFGLGLVTGILPLTIVGAIGAGLAVGAALGYGPGQVLASGASSASAFLGGLASLTVASLSTTAVVALVSIPVIVAIILFIINSGAYLVPPRAGLIPTETEIVSPYVGIEKEASPFRIDKITGSEKVTYQIRIFAKKGTLTNIKITNSYQIAGGSGAPPLDPDIKEIESPPEIISPANDFVFSYGIDLDEKYNNAVVIDTLTVTADSPEQKGVMARQSASVIVGKVSIGCFTFNEEGGPYLDVYSLGWDKYPGRYNRIVGIISMLSQTPNWLSLVCSGGTITLTHARQDGSWGGYSPSATKKDVIFYSLYGITETTDSQYNLYLFAHESGHIIDYNNAIALSKYTELAKQEGYLPTYPACCRSDAEDLAETIGRYAISDPVLGSDKFKGHKQFGRFIFSR